VALSTMEPAAKKSPAGKSLSCSTDDNLALADKTPLVLQCSVSGNGQSMAKLSARIRSRFLERVPPASGTKPQSGGERDPRRWGGRSAAAGKKRWETIKAACTLYKRAIDFLEAARMTGNTTEAQKKRCYLACYNAHADEGMSSRTKHLKTIARDMHYPAGTIFEYLACYDSLIRNTNLLVTSTPVSDPGVYDAGDEKTTSGRPGTSTAPDGGVGVDGVVGASIDDEQEKGGDLGIDVEGKGAKIDTGRKVRPDGTKAAKRRKDLKRTASAQPTPADAGDVEMVTRLGSLADAWCQESAQKQQRHEDNQRVQGDKLALSAFNSLYAGASMTLEERRSALEEPR